jgi:predicted restriction endonuclease
LRPSKKLLKKLDGTISGISYFLDPKNFDLSPENDALVELASSLILDSEKKKGKKGSRKQFSKLTRQAVLIAQKFRCMLCGIQLEIVDFDHIDGNSSNNSISNCQALCPNCHAKKTRKIC